MGRLLILLSFLATPVFADNGCDDLWFTRNLIFDRAGYCFGSPLGQFVFNNGNCTGTTVTLDVDAKRFVDHIRGLETQYGCVVDTNRSQLDLNDIAIKTRLVDLPVRDQFASGCLGWVGEPVALYAGRNQSSGAIGRIDPGDFVSFAHNPVAGWAYVTTHGANWTTLKSGGWMVANLAENACRDWAG